MYTNKRMQISLDPDSFLQSKNKQLSVSRQKASFHLSVSSTTPGRAKPAKDSGWYLPFKGSDTVDTSNTRGAKKISTSKTKNKYGLDVVEVFHKN